VDYTAEDDGGCAAASAPATWLGALVALVALRRRR
jgi:Synergist-CTERM protein sorting domain-containing protein